MLSYLEKAFGDPDRKQNAENKLYNLKQRNLDFSVFFAEFERLALKSEVPEAALPPLLSQGVSREIQDMLLHNPAPTREYRAFARHLQTLDNRFRQHQRQVNGHKGTIKANSTTTPASPNVPPRNEPRPPAAKTDAGDPMDLSHQRSRPRSPSGRRERGECFRCGHKGHIVAQCPEPDRRPVQFRQARTPSPRESPPPTMSTNLLTR